MRVLLIDLGAEWRGGQSQGLLLLRGLRERGHEAELLAVSGGAFAGRAAAEDVPVHASSTRLRRVSAAWMTRTLLTRQRFDVVHANDAHALTAAWFVRAHRVSPLVVARRVLFPVSRDVLSMARYRAASCIIAVSEAVRDELCAAGMDAAKIAVVADGVEPTPPITSEERAAARARWGFAPSAHVVSYVASLTAEKGHDLLLDAFAELRRSVPSCRLLLAGSGPLLQILREKARGAGVLSEVCFAGFVQDPRAVYAASDVFLFPSRREGLGSSLLGAMACGLPVVALGGGAMSEIVEDGRDGLTVAAGAPLLAAAAGLLLRDQALSSRLGGCARQTVEARFSASRMVEATLRIYERVTPGA